MATKVMQVDYDTFEPIETYDSIKDAAEDNWINDVLLGVKLKKGNGLALYNGRGRGLDGRKLAFKIVSSGV